VGSAHAVLCPASAFRPIGVVRYRRRARRPTPCILDLSNPLFQSMEHRVKRLQVLEAVRFQAYWITNK
jgi:hypothetical protein